MKYERYTTDPKYTKNVRVPGKQPFTNIDTYYLIEQASHTFGLYGETWGIKSESWEYMDVGDTKLAVLHAVFFFPDGEFPITNSGKMVYKAKSGYLMIDEDIYKKLETNTIGKALSRIGFGTDVYLGKFEDSDYVNEAFGQHETLSPQQLQELTKGIAYYQADPSEVLKEFGAPVLKEIAASDFERAKAFVKQTGKKKEK